MLRGLRVSERKLLFSITKKDFEIQTFRCGGKGGQKQNKTNSGVRIIHKESGMRGESRTHRSQPQNRAEAFKRLVNSKEFKLWHKMKVGKILSTEAESIEKIVEKSMCSENLKIECIEN